VTTIEPVALDDGTFSPSYTDGKSLWAAGMGLSNTKTNTIPSRLQEIEVEYVSDDICRQETEVFLSTGDATLCGRHPSGAGGICFGDSGGPLYDKDNQVLVGIVSYVVIDCGTPSSDVYSRVSDKFSWIKSIICAQLPSDSICNQTAKPTTSPAPTSQWCDETHVEITINPDLYPIENTFYIKNLQSNQLLIGNSLEGFAPDVTHEGNLCLPAGNQECYVFGILDYYGDGIDVDGTDPDYCIKVNDQVLSCNADFTGALETVVFPEESCRQSCDPSFYTLEISTTMASQLTLVLKDSRGNDILPYNFNAGSSFTTVTVPVDLCRGCYQLHAENYRDATFSLTDKETNDVIVSNSQFSKTSEVAFFSVGGAEDCESNTSAAPSNRIGWSSTGSTITSMIMATVVMTIGGVLC
jgi:Secreted trypsin-like serine protease